MVLLEKQGPEDWGARQGLQRWSTGADNQSRCGPCKGTLSCAEHVLCCWICCFALLLWSNSKEGFILANFEGIQSITVGKEWQLFDGESMWLAETPHLLIPQGAGHRTRPEVDPGYKPQGLTLCDPFPFPGAPPPKGSATSTDSSSTSWGPSVWMWVFTRVFHIQTLTAGILQLCGHTQGMSGWTPQEVMLRARALQQRSVGPHSSSTTSIQETFCNSDILPRFSFHHYISRGLA